MPKSPLVTINVNPATDIDVRAAEERRKYAAKFLRPGIVRSNTKCISIPKSMPS